MTSSQNSSPTIVVGPGRSGTTFVASILHERLGIHMGSRFRNDPQGKSYYEDLDFRNLNRHFLDNNLNFSEWLAGAQRLIEMRDRAHLKWGFKDPRASYIMGMYLMFFDEPKFVRCVRNHDDVAGSMMKNYDWPLDKALNIVRERSLALDRFLKGREVLELTFDSWQDEGLVEGELKEFLNVNNN